MSRDWDAWARKVERALDVVNRTDTDFQDLFAPDATFIDPTQVAKTPELPEVSRATQAIFPDWTQEVTSIRGGDDWAAFEWIGRGTFTWKGKSTGRAIEIMAAGSDVPMDRRVAERLLDPVMQLVRNAIRKIGKIQRLALCLDGLAQLRVPIQGEFFRWPEIAVAHDMRDRIRERRTELQKQFEAIALPVDDPQHDETPGQLIERAGERPAVLCDTRLASRCCVDDNGRVPVHIAKIDEVDPAAGVVQIT